MSRKTTKQNRRITLVVDGVSYGTWDTRTGGALSATVTKWRPGGMGPEQSTGGLQTTSDVVLTRRHDLDDDYPKYLDLKRRRRVGIARAVVTDQPLDELGAPYGTPDVFTGRLSNMEPPEADSNSTDPSMMSATVVVETA